jgi:hypothetical protein
VRMEHGGIFGWEHHDGKGMCTYYFDELLYSFSAVLVGILGVTTRRHFLPCMGVRTDCLNWGEAGISM